jgi:glycosyltransferase involved in cell wall biosynthesis
MRIAQVAPLAESVPPKLYGGTERVVSWLTEELVSLGHEVTLFASEDSVTKAELEPVPFAALRFDGCDPMVAYGCLLSAIAAKANDFDVIHLHVDWIHLPLLRRLGVPFLTTLHGRLDLPELSYFLEHFAAASFVSVSNAQRAARPGLSWIGTVHHGVPEGLLEPCYRPEGHLAFLGRIAPEKGPDTAVRVARAAGLPLRMAAKVDKKDRAYYEAKIKPLIEEGGGVEFVGEIDDAQKREFLGKSGALLFPICWPEPFGLAVIEAMACGTPVVAYRNGSIPELVDHGLTGFIVNPGDEGGLVDAVRKISMLDREKVRRVFERRFTAKRMAADYVGLYRTLGLREYSASGGVLRHLSSRDLQAHKAANDARRQRPV